jgi:hypothetical protein
MKSLSVGGDHRFGGGGRVARDWPNVIDCQR